MSKKELLSLVGFLLTAASGAWTGYSLLQGSLWFGVIYVLWTLFKVLLVLFLKKNLWTIYMWSWIFVFAFPFVGKLLKKIAAIEKKSIEGTIRIFVFGMALAVLVLSLLRVVV